MTNNILDNPAWEFSCKIVRRFCKFVKFWQSSRRKNNIWDNIICPVSLNNFVKWMRLVVKCNRWLIPVSYNFIFFIKRYHIIHCINVGLNVANHDFYFVTNTIIHFSYSACAFIYCVFLCCKIMQSNIVCAIASKCECYFFAH